MIKYVSFDLNFLKSYNQKMLDIIKNKKNVFNLYKFYEPTNKNFYDLINLMFIIELLIPKHLNKINYHYIYSNLEPNLLNFIKTINTNGFIPYDFYIKFNLNMNTYFIQYPNNYTFLNNNLKLLFFNYINNYINQTNNINLNNIKDAIIFSATKESYNIINYIIDKSLYLNSGMALTDEQLSELLGNIYTGLTGNYLQLNSLNSSLTGTNIYLDTLNSSFNNSNIKLDSLNSSFNNSNIKLDKINSSLTGTNNKLDTLNIISTYTNNKLDLLNSSLTGTNNKLDTLNSSLTGTNVSLNVVNEKLTSLIDYYTNDINEQFYILLEKCKIYNYILISLIKSVNYIKFDNIITEIIPTNIIDIIIYQQKIDYIKIVKKLDYENNLKYNNINYNILDIKEYYKLKNYINNINSLLNIEYYDLNNNIFATINNTFNKIIPKLDEYFNLKNNIKFITLITNIDINQYDNYFNYNIENIINILFKNLINSYDTIINDWNNLGIIIKSYNDDKNYIIWNNLNNNINNYYLLKYYPFNTSYYIGLTGKIEKITNNIISDYETNYSHLIFTNTPTGPTGYQYYTNNVLFYNNTGYISNTGLTYYTDYINKTGYTGYNYSINKILENNLTGLTSYTGYTSYTNYTGVTGYTNYTYYISNTNNINYYNVIKPYGPTGLSGYIYYYDKTDYLNLSGTNNLDYIISKYNITNKYNDDNITGLYNCNLIKNIQLELNNNNLIYVRIEPKFVINYDISYDDRIRIIPFEYIENLTNENLFENNQFSNKTFKELAKYSVSFIIIGHYEYYNKHIFRSLIIDNDNNNYYSIVDVIEDYIGYIKYNNVNVIKIQFS